MEKTITRREFHKVAATFDLNSTLLAWAGLEGAGAASLEARAASASALKKRRDERKARFELEFGAAHFTREGLEILPNGTQNAAAEAPYLYVLDFPCLWPSRASQYRFFYSPRSETLLREPLRKFHKLHLLFTHCELRGGMRGLKYREKPKIMTVGALSGAKVRVTGITAPPLPGSYYHEHEIRNCIWSAGELEKAERMTSPRFNPEPWEKWRMRLDRMAGGIDIYESLYEAAREMPEGAALDVEPRRWWKG